MFLRRNVRRVRTARASGGYTKIAVPTYGAKIIAARRIQRAYRRRRNPNLPGPRAVGESNLSAICKSKLAENAAPQTRVNGILFSVDLTQVSFGQEINQRERGMINCRGIKFDLNFQNLSGSSACYINVALLCPKATSIGDAVTNTAFFRSNGINRQIDYTTGLAPFDKWTLNINTDEYIVLWHKKKILAPNSTQSAAEAMNLKNSGWYLKRYTKIGRQIRYANPESDTATDGRMFLVYWGGTYGAVDETTPGSFQYCSKIVHYFKDPKN